jgi:Xaa-Pro aminopeptidase
MTTVSSRRADLPAMEVASRARRIVDALAELDLDGLLVTHLANIRYLTGFTGSAALLLVTASDGLAFVTDGRYGEQAAEQLATAGAEATVEVGRTNAEQRAVVQAAASGFRRVGLEAAHVSWSAQRDFETAWFPDATLVPTEGVVERLREVKDDGEVARIEVAAAIADEALANVRHRLGEGVTEREFAFDLEVEMRRLGADGPSFETIVGSGPNGAKPHARPMSRVVGDGDLVVLDFGALVDGYHSDISRTICVGEPTGTQRRMLDVVTASQAAGVAAVAAGRSAADVDRTCRDVIDEAGWGDAFLHGTGHGVGLDIHEAPRVSATSDATLAAGQVVTVEPGVYLPEHGGVRVEDTLLVTPDGARALTHSPKHWTI